jgi:hypothetical protein
MHHPLQLLKTHPFHFLKIGLRASLSSSCLFVPSHELLILTHLPPVQSVQLHVQSLDFSIQLSDRGVTLEDIIEHASHLSQLGQLDGVSGNWLELRQVAVAALSNELYLLQTAQGPGAPAHAGRF